ncbi:hypothetical protein SAMN04489761_2653 [Tenacibaculum sp. MAR_2009_124]|uniref:hypothetical protein n=1 Tax=Tenacibaculum sp. MAR_2009_124 TaxID=1250059 RepID=UPI0008967600|nr:hypothetical protein [Tenacibaculum sp. MAR_2009_124]SEC31442.1 hypothetical protein SAMN04489761_2653 [Tenacibaculum sp. MAR_2009_124]
MKTTIKIALIAMIGISFGVRAQNETVNGNLTVKGSSSSRGASSIYSTEIGKTQFRISTNIQDAENAFLYNYNQDAKTFHTINFGGTHSLSSGITVLGNGDVGIGASSPASKLDIRGNLIIDSGNTPHIYTSHENIEKNKFLLLLNSPNYRSASRLKVGGLLISDTYSFANPDKNDLIVKGKVGIGTSSAKSKFQISGTPNDRILISNSAINFNTNSPKLSFFGYTYGDQITGPSLQKIHTASYGRGRLAIFQHGGADYSSEEEVMSILPDGNIGIGITEPKSKLDVNGSIVVKNGHNLSWGNKYGEGIPTIAGNTTSGLHFYPNGSTLGATMQILKDGKTKFMNNIAVLGKIESREVKVSNTPTADFVFEEDYSLPSLKSVDKYIKEKKHLPEIASAKKMKRDGVNIGNFQIQLLQKIEELTLYTIEQEKKIKALEEQTKEIKELKVLVNKLLEDKN